MKNKDVYVHITYYDGSSKNFIVKKEQTNFYISMDSIPKRVNAPQHFKNWEHMSAVDRFLSNMTFIYGNHKKIDFEIID